MLEESRRRRLSLKRRWKPKGIDFPDSLWEEELHHMKYGERLGGQKPYPDISKVRKVIKSNYEDAFEPDTTRKQIRWPMSHDFSLAQFFVDNAPSHCGVVIPTEGRPELLQKCLDTIAKNSMLDLSVLIVDDGARKPVKKLDFIKHRKEIYNFPIIVKRPGGNERHGAGFGRAFGQKYWHERGRHWVISMDDDAFIHEHCFENLYASAMINDNYGIIGALGSFRQFYHGNWRDEFTVTGVGVCYIINKWAIDLCGNFDRRMKARQDVDLAVRMHLNGFRVCILPKADVNHIRYRTKKEKSSERREMFDQWKGDAGKLMEKKYSKFGFKCSEDGKTIRFLPEFEKRGYIRKEWWRKKVGGK